MGKYFFLIISILIFCTVHISFAQDYVVGEEDIIKITVYDHPDLTTVSRVSGDGNITFPLIGNLRVAGQTVSQISKKIAELLSDGYIIDPHVSIFIEEFRSKKTTLMGQVTNPGVYVLRGNTTFLELLSKAGGLTKDAGEKAIIKRKAQGSATNEIILKVDLKKLIRDGDTSQDVPVMDNDNIYIEKAGVFFITGEVKKPDAYRHEEGITVMKAVSLAGGFTDKAGKGRVKIIRKLEGKEQVIGRANMDEPVLPDDIIIVPESFF
jgi:polysaccharide export outer membrane protein